MEPEDTSIAAFRAQTFPYVKAVYSDARCLTSCREDAVDLVVETYLHAFREYAQRWSGSAADWPGVSHPLPWLYRHLHAAFCERVLARPGTLAAKGGHSS